MRQMSVTATVGPVQRHEKTDTRRLGWKNLKPGELTQLVEKGQGLKKGEHVKKICVVRILSNQRESLCAIYDEPDGCKREGFPELTPDQFVAFFCNLNNCYQITPVNHIKWEYVD